MDFKKIMLAVAEQQADQFKEKAVAWVQSDEFEEELVASVPVSAPIQVEMEEPTLLEELEAKSIAGEGNARLNRRMKRTQETEIAEIIASTGL